MTQRPYLFLLDYDGTLTDFKRNPEHSYLSPSARKILRGLERKYPVIFVSGRYLKSLRQVSGLQHFPMIGTHGFEGRRLPGGLRLASLAQEKLFKREAARLWEALRELKKKFPQIHIEKKPYSSTLHYRGIPLTPRQVKDLRRSFHRIFIKAVTRRRWSLMEGKQMIEAKPRGFSKGQAVQKVIRHFPGHRPVYAGDDITDISVFKLLGKKGLKIAVGNRIPKKYYDLRFKSPKELLEWLKHI
jgi:trehalose 6-phosphate phosphatase